MASELKKVVVTAPERIWLCVSDDPESADNPFPTDPHGDEVTWAENEVLDVCVPYVRADRLAAMDGGWRPIEEAPRDGTIIWIIEDGGSLGLSVPHQCQASWLAAPVYEAGGAWVQLDAPNVCHPTHWQPLPAPPQGA